MITKFVKFLIVFLFFVQSAFAEIDTSEITYPPSNSTRIAEPNTNENTDATDSIDDSLFPQKNKVDKIWEEYNNKFLYDIEGADNMQVQKAQEIVDNDIAHKLHITLEYTNLRKCLETALENNFNLKIQYEQVDTNRWNYRTSQSQYIPNFYYQYDLSHIEGEFLVGDVLLDNLDYNPVSNTFSFGWFNFNPIRIFFNARANKRLWQAEANRYQFTKDEVILNTALQYYNLIGQKLNIEVLRINLREREQQLKMTQGRYMIGVGTKFDILRAEAQVAQAKQQYIATYNQLRLNQARLANIMGIEVLTPVYPFEMTISTIETLPPDCTIEHLYDVSLSARDDIKAQEKQIAHLRELKKVVWTDYAPNFNMTYTHQFLGILGESLRANKNISFMGQIYLGEGLGIGTYTKLKSFDAQIAQQELVLKDLKRQIKEDILNSYYDSLTSKERIKSAQKEVTAGDEGLKNALIRWDIGENTFLDVLQAQTTKTNARRELIDATIEYNKSQVQLLFDAGIISVNAILENYHQTEEYNPHNIME